MKGSYTRKYIYIYNVNRALFRWVALNTHAPFQRERERESRVQRGGMVEANRTGGGAHDLRVTHPPTPPCDASIHSACSVFDQYIDVIALGTALIKKAQTIRFGSSTFVQTTLLRVEFFFYLL